MHYELTVSSSRPLQVTDVTRLVADAVSRAGIDEGMCTVYVPHATAAIVINESADPEIGNDLLEALDKLIPAGIWRHDRIDDNGSAHIKAAILGPSETIPVRGGRLALGTWQAIMLVDLDGPRRRQLLVTIR